MSRRDTDGPFAELRAYASGYERGRLAGFFEANDSRHSDRMLARASAALRVLGASDREIAVILEQASDDAERLGVQAGELLLETIRAKLGTTRKDSSPETPKTGDTRVPVLRSEAGEPTGEPGLSPRQSGNKSTGACTSEGASSECQWCTFQLGPDEGPTLCDQCQRALLVQAESSLKSSGANGIAAELARAADRLDNERPKGCVCTWEYGDSPCPVHGEIDDYAPDVVAGVTTPKRGAP